MMQKTPEKKPLQESQLMSDFKCGDLLYGLHHQGRKPFLDELAQRPQGNQIWPGYFTIDDINRILSPAIIFKQTGDNTLNSPEEKYDQVVSMHLSSWRSHPKYWPDNITGDEEQREKKIFKGSCKVALLTYPNTIRFCLDGLSPDAIYNRSDRYYSNYTSSELRFCAKNWSNIQDRVIFYIEGELCAPPWGLDDPRQWFESKSSEMKGLSLLKTDSNQMGRDGLHSSRVPERTKIPKPVKKLVFSQEDFPREDSNLTADSPAKSPPTVSLASLVNTERKKLNFNDDYNTLDENIIAAKSLLQ